MNTTKPQHSNHENGQGLVEYALILVLVSITVIAALSLLGTSVANVFYDVTYTLKPTKFEVVRAYHWEPSNTIYLELTYEGGYDSSITLTTPYGNMKDWGGSYGIEITSADTSTCPCTIWIDASNGERFRVTTVERE